MKFKIGDKVIYSSPVIAYAFRPTPGAIGTVVKIDSNCVCLVKWDRPLQSPTYAGDNWAYYNTDMLQFAYGGGF